MILNVAPLGSISDAIRPNGESSTSNITVPPCLIAAATVSSVLATEK